MIKVIFSDGSKLQGRNALEIISQLKLEDWTVHTDTEAYKKNMYRRVENFYGKQIEYSSDMEFLQELQRVGFIRFIIFE